MLKVFISYAHDDFAAFRELRKQLRAIARTHQIEFLADERNKAGYHWRDEIANFIGEAKAHILMFSPAFIGADYIFDHELPAIDAKCQQGDLVVPVVIDRCAWKAFVEPLQPAPLDRSRRLVPISDWRPRNHGYDAAREQIEAAIKEQFNPPRRTGFAWAKP